MTTLSTSELSFSNDPTLLPEYLSRFSDLTQDLDHWHEFGITTPRQLGDYLDCCVVKETLIKRVS